MKKIRKSYVIVFSIFFLFGIGAGILLIVFFSKKTVIPKTVDVFGAPREKNQQNFPKQDPKFTVVIGAIKPASLHQESITVYQINDPKKTAVFQRPFYSDGFRGNELTYTFSSSSALITQSGSLGSLGCKSNDCTLTWNNFYIWNASSHTFVLDNVSHKNEFQQLFTTYQRIDKNGCSIVGGKLLAAHDRLSFTELYKKYSTASYYCSQSQGILPSNLIFFLQAEKTLQEIVHDENVGSTDIRNITL